MFSGLLLTKSGERVSFVDICILIAIFALNAKFLLKWTYWIVVLLSEKYNIFRKLLIILNVLLWKQVHSKFFKPDDKNVELPFKPNSRKRISMKNINVKQRFKKLSNAKMISNKKDSKISKKQKTKVKRNSNRIDSLFEPTPKSAVSNQAAQLPLANKLGTGLPTVIMEESEERSPYDNFNPVDCNDRYGDCYSNKMPKSMSDSDDFNIVEMPDSILGSNDDEHIYQKLSKELYGKCLSNSNDIF